MYPMTQNLILHSHFTGGSGSGSLPTESEIISDSDYRFSISGNGSSLLTINVFSPMLNGSTIFCHDEAYTLDANFSLRSTRTYGYDFRE